MTLQELMKRIPSEWKNVPLGVKDSGVARAVESVELVETTEGKLCVILHGDPTPWARGVAKKDSKESA